VCGYGVYFFGQIHREEWAAEDEAVRTAYAKTVLARAEKVVPFTLDSTGMVVFGEDKLGQQVIVWVNGDQTHTEYARDAKGEHDVIAEWQKRVPGGRLLRVIPGKLQDTYVWEIFYKVSEEGSDHYYYDYYRFKDGAFLETYRLTLQ